jgi:two-component system CheB/CheR fusion protein
MARAHEALASRRWGAVPFDDLVRLTLSPYGDRAGSRIRASGDPVELGPAASAAMCMVLHELATNAAKYGSLSISTGLVDLEWRCADDGTFLVEWREHGGPPVDPPSNAGLGTRLLRGIVEHELSGHVALDYRAEGLCCRIELPRGRYEAGPRVDGDPGDSPRARQTSQGTDRRIVRRAAPS